MGKRHADQRHAIRELVGEPDQLLARMGLDKYDPQFMLWEAGPYDVTVAEFAQRAGAPIDQVKSWKCPCCVGVKALYADGTNGLFFRLMVSTQNSEMGVLCKFDSIDDLDGLAETWPDEHDRMLLEVYLAMGLYDALRELFVA